MLESRTLSNAVLNMQDTPASSQRLYQDLLPRTAKDSYLLTVPHLLPAPPILN